MGVRGLRTNSLQHKLLTIDNLFQTKQGLRETEEKKKRLTLNN